VADQTEPVPPGPDILVALRRAGAGSLHEQLEHSLRELIRAGTLAPGARMPSTRGLARQLSVSRGIVLEAYAQLVAEGYLVASQGAPTRVASGLAVEPFSAPAASFLTRRDRYDLDPSLPDLGSFPREQWARFVRSAIRTAPAQLLGRVDPRGEPELRNALRDYLGRVRGAAAEPEHTLVCSGFRAGLAAICRLLAARGVDRVAVEQPGQWQVLQTLEAAGLEAVPVAVDEHGVRVEELLATDCEVVVVAPAHQFPTGAVLSPERRAALVEWADERDGLIVEDDYDSELRYDREAVGALQGLAPERVACVGSLSVRLSPALALGWVLSPSWLTGGLAYEHGIGGGVPPAFDQLALAEFVARGELDRHLRRRRLDYRRRREALAAAVASRLEGAELRGPAAGVFAYVALPVPGTAQAIAAAAAGRGVAATPAGPDGLALGFAHPSERELLDGIERLAHALTDI
jgi:GntR family transcriptional regulator/MocR family aminotransferase